MARVKDQKSIYYLPNNPTDFSIKFEITGDTWLFSTVILSAYRKKPSLVPAAAPTVRNLSDVLPFQG